MRARHVSISSDPAVAATQNAENARDINAALSGLLDAYVYTVEPYVATGSSSSTIPLRSEKRPPSGVVTLRVMPLDDPLSAVSLPTIHANIVYDSLRGSLSVFEPDGLTANSRYRLSFLVVR